MIIPDYREKSINEEKGAVFDYSYMQIFSTESVICKCVGLLRYDQWDSTYLLENLLKADIPELLIFYEAAQDQKLKEEILKKINEKATETSLEVYDDSRALDLVMNFQIESLYPAVDYMLKKKFKRWGTAEFVRKEYYYQQAARKEALADKKVNSSIGSQWRYRIDKVDKQIKNATKNMSDIEKKTTKMNINN